MKWARIGIAVALSAVMGCGTSSTPEAEEQALASADAWLELVDGGDYGGSYEQAAAYFKSAVTPEGWTASVGGVRGPLGPVVSRKVKSRTYATSLPGAPDGEYVVIQYDSVFENKQAAVETVTPMKDGDGTWRVSGYYVN